MDNYKAVKAKKYDIKVNTKYNGNMKIEHNDTMFVVSIIIYIAKKNE